MIKVGVQDDPFTRSIKIGFSWNEVNGLYTYRWPAKERIKVVEAVEVPNDAWLRLPEDQARAMYDALGRFYGDTPVDSRMLREDLLHERGRVDQFINHLTLRDS